MLKEDDFSSQTILNLSSNSPEQDLETNQILAKHDQLINPHEHYNYFQTC